MSENRSEANQAMSARAKSKGMSEHRSRAAARSGANQAMSARAKSKGI